jgi:hypothetical protein
LSLRLLYWSSTSRHTTTTHTISSDEVPNGITQVATGANTKPKWLDENLGGCDAKIKTIVGWQVS